MSLRAGGGLFYYSRLPGLFLNDAAISAPFSLRIDLNDSTTGASQIGSLSDPLATYPNFTSGFPQRYTLKTAPKDATFVANPTVFGLQPGVKWTTPEIYDWNVTFERQLRADTVLHASYVGTRGTHLRQDVNLNPGVYTAGSTASSCKRGGLISRLASSTRIGTPAPTPITALQVAIEKRPASSGSGILNQITLLANYSYAHANDYGLSENGGITDIGSSIGSGMSFYDPRQHAFETGPATFDRRHHVVASYVWNLPRLNGSNALVRNVVGGWQWTGIYSFTVRRPADHPGWNRPIPDRQRILIARITSALQISSASWRLRASAAGVLESSTACRGSTQPFSQNRQQGTMETSGKGTWRGPNLWNADTGLIKNFYPVPSHEAFNFQFRAEFFNLFNHPQWSDPNVTFSNGAFGSTRSTIGTATGNVGTTADSRIIQLALKMNF